jgi:plasmid segregation protein ParM
MVYQKAFDISRLMPVAHSYAQRAVGAMLERIPADYSFQNIVLVGGGAFLYRKAVREAFPRHRIHEVREPIFANVRGFQLAGMNFMRSIAGETTAPGGATLAASTGGEAA